MARAIWSGMRACLALLLLAGCAEPAVPDYVGEAAVAGVTIAAETGAWTGGDSDMVAAVTPLRVTVSNAGSHDLRIAPEAFSLIGEDRRNFVPLDPGAGIGALEPPPEMRALAIPETVLPPGHYVSGFVYFPEEAGIAGDVLRVRLRDAGTGRALGTARVRLEPED